MALSAVDQLRGRPVEVMFAGLRSDTYAMQRAGWRIAMEAGHYADLFERARFVFVHDSLSVALIGESRIDSMSRGLGDLLAPIFINQAFHADGRHRFRSAHDLAFVARDDALRPIDATPAFMQVTTRDLFEMPFFQTLHVPAAEPLIVDQATVSDLLERIRAMQAPEQAEIRARNTSRERAHGRIHAHIMSLAA
jgi:hypothetical protein